MTKTTRMTFSGAVISFIIGIAYLVITLPRGTMNLGTQFNSMPLYTLGEWGFRVNMWIDAITPGYEVILTWVLWAIVAYLGAILLLSLRHQQLSYLLWALFCLVVSTAIFHVIAWGGFILANLYFLLIRLLVWFGGLLATIIGWLAPVIVNLFRAILDLLYQIFEPLLGLFWWVGAVAVVFLLALIIYKFRLPLANALRAALRFSMWGLLAGGVIYLLFRVWEFFAPYIEILLAFLARAVLFIYRLVEFLFIMAAILIAISTIGQLFLDQFKGATIAGNRRLGVMLGAIAIGTTLGILLLVSNIYGTNEILPTLVSRFSDIYFYQPAPTIDALIALAIIGLSTGSVLYNIPELRREPTLDEFGKSLVYQAAGVFVAGALVAVGSQSES
jgi:hypothetical protein